MSLFKDLIYQIRGRYFKSSNKEYTFGFLVHSRSYKDIYRKYPRLGFIPKSVMIFVMNNLWPITLSKVTGVYFLKDKKEIGGYVLGITATSEHLMKNRKSALRKIRSTVYLAKGRGIKIVGLGGLTSSLSGGGTQLLDIGVNITTGHAYTAYNVTQNVFALMEDFGVPKEKLKLAVVGSAGSVGTTSSLILARAGVMNLTLIDVERKKDSIEDLKNKIYSLNPNISVRILHNVKDIVDCDFIITATNASEALITTSVVKPGMVFVDDAQPSDIHPDVLNLNDVLAIEAGVVRTPGIYSNFNYGLKNKNDNFCCMAELLVLASHQWEDHYVINRATLEHVDSISEMGKELGFKISNFQNFKEVISQEKINNVKSIMRNKYGL